MGPPRAEGPSGSCRGQARAGQLLARVRPPPNRLRLPPPPPIQAEPPKANTCKLPPPLGRQHPRGTQPGAAGPPPPREPPKPCTHRTRMHRPPPPQLLGAVGGLGCGLQPCGGAGTGTGVELAVTPPHCCGQLRGPPAAGWQTAPWRSGGIGGGRSRQVGSTTPPQPCPGAGDGDRQSPRGPLWSLAVPVGRGGPRHREMPAGLRLAGRGQTDAPPPPARSGAEGAPGGGAEAPHGTAGRAGGTKAADGAAPHPKASAGRGVTPACTPPP